MRIAIELSKKDLLDAVVEYVKKRGYTVSAEDIFINSDQTATVNNSAIPTKTYRNGLDIDQLK